MNTTSVDSAVDDGRVTTDIRDHVRMIDIGQPAKRHGLTPVMLRALAQAGEPMAVAVKGATCTQGIDLMLAADIVVAAENGAGFHRLRSSLA